MSCLHYLVRYSLVAGSLPLYYYRTNCLVPSERIHVYFAPNGPSDQFERNIVNNM